MHTNISTELTYIPAKIVLHKILLPAKILPHKILLLDQTIKSLVCTV